MTDTFSLKMPERQTTSVIFASPHSGRDYSAEFLDLAILNKTEIRSSEDAFVDDLFAAVPDHGAPLLSAVAPRAFVDLNRNRDELDAALIRDVPKSVHNPRIYSGLGVIPRVVASGRAIYRGKISKASAEARLNDYWTPYHNQLTQLIDQTKRDFGLAVLLDLHSMPHEAIDSPALNQLPKPEVVLGDRYGVSAAPDVVDRIEESFRKAGLRVMRNVPFAGAFVTDHYGRPANGQHAVQIEIDRSIYMDEKRVKPNANFAHVQALMTSIVKDLVTIGQGRIPLAAE